MSAEPAMLIQPETVHRPLPLVRQAAVLGAGVMGAQIAAQFANAGIPVLLFDLANPGGDKSTTARDAIAALAKMKPEPLASESAQGLISPCNYDDDLQRLADCQLVIEAIAERTDWKRDLFQRVAPHLHEQAVLASNTSGLSINTLAKDLSVERKARFVGIHFFNPPRYMHLVELVPSEFSVPEVLDNVEAFLVTDLGKGVVRARDTANFIANRIGVFAMMITLHHARELGLNFETVDALTGRHIGHPKSATFRTADVVGLDTLRHVLRGSMENLEGDPWASLYAIPDWLDDLVEDGALGQKSRRGVYLKKEGEILVYEPETREYRKRKIKLPGKVEKLLATRDPTQFLPKLRAMKDPQAQFVWRIHRDTFHYAAHLLEEIADSARQVDLALRWGFGWDHGPFETWQRVGWRAVAGMIREDIIAGKTPVDVPLPKWVDDIDHIHGADGSWSATHQRYEPRPDLPVYARQACPQCLLGEKQSDGDTVLESDATRIWHQDDGVLLISFKTKLHTINDAVIQDLNLAVELAEREYDGLVIWHPDEPFSAGADLKSYMPIAMKSLLPGSTALEDLLNRFQGVCIHMRRASIPVVAGVQGLALGGGCELMMQCDRVVAAQESYVGLVEAGVGLLPAGSGCMEFARRADQRSSGKDLFPLLSQAFETIAMAKVATSGHRAREMGFLRETDLVIMNRHEVLHAAKAQVKALKAAGYRPMAERPIRVGGREAMANLKAAMVNLHAGGRISDYDMVIGEAVADTLCGGDLDAGTEVSMDWLLRRERENFRQLIRHTKTHARVAHMLKTGKPLRN